MLLSDKHIVIGSRGSELAKWQSGFIKNELKARYPSIEIDIKIIKTTGDHLLDSPLSEIGGKGVFTVELEESLLRNEIDIAVHSLKDLPTAIHPELVIAAIPMRADVRDALLTNENGMTLASLPAGATVATGSLRRKAQLLALRPDIHIIDIRGNVPTRVKKLRENNWDAMLLAAAGLTRLSMESEISEYIDTDVMLPAPGQGALAIECRADDSETISLLVSLNDEETSRSVNAERIILEALGGGCQLPLGTYVYPNTDGYFLSACFADIDGSSLVRRKAHSSKESLIESARSLASGLLSAGADIILERLHINEVK
ncbi:MAG TPA: hydroxymethylbilane synthase [Candidatus Kapabacteria bacterium]|nr:hydroxymethylbilane synthase [Candidatus Kapabacteria bacterium]